LALPTTLFCDGVDAGSGLYVPAPRTLEEIARIALGERWDPEYLESLQDRSWREEQSAFLPPDDADVDDLATTGWGVIFARDADPAIREALSPLLDHRRAAAAGARETYYREMAGERAYRAGESTRDFLLSRGAEPTGPADPETMPYYLLLVGDPQQIPFQLQYELDVEHAVGRIWFPRAEDYAQYARRVVAAETAGPLPRRSATFFGTRNPDDAATALSADSFIAPLAALVAQDHPSWQVRTLLGDEATKSRLAATVHGADAPGLLFTASHGVCFREGDPRKNACQGALLCQDWPGPEQWKGPLSPDFYFAGRDFGLAAPLPGGIAFHFACYSAGTPDTNDFLAYSAVQTPARQPFLAGLPVGMLAHPKGGPLAVVGHVERSWACSFYDKTYGQSQLKVFRQSLRRLLAGHPIGYAMELLNLRHATLAAQLANELDRARRGPADPQTCASLWIANHDARNYLLLGDPAVRLHTAG
jgi:hypothetical protein